MKQWPIVAESDGVVQTFLKYWTRPGDSAPQTKSSGRDDGWGAASRGGGDCLCLSIR
ncbi:hypothetical protein ALSL_1276 [Aerosticca soli]|uniref:Uncharacterized protein n=1 Tax=Aerosticca soli TaxID=2010829 RepID=A0A2Z6E5E0_9GAMM|nr:hypothetical protein ALSL_1276 [Aerosticca soli]